MDKLEALRLADALDRQYLHACEPAAAELRRLHEENGRLRIVAEMSTLLLAQRSALLEALKLARPYINTNTLDGYYAEVKADAAIRAVEENT